MSRRVVYVHVGAPKTGTTYVQDRLGLNRRSLAKHGVHVPAKTLVSPGLFHFRAALDLLGQDWGGEPGHAQGAWDQLVRKVKRLDGTVVISHEILAPARPEAVARLKRDLGPDTELHVVYTARDLGRQVPAGWQESIKQGRRWRYRRYLKRIRTGRPWFMRAFDLPSVLGTWGEGLPPEHVHVVTVPPSAALKDQPDLLWRRMCEVLGIDPAWAPRDSDRTNTSLGAAETEVLRRLNRRLERATRREAEYDELIRGMLAEDQLVRRRSRRVTLPPRMHEWAVDQTEAWVAWIQERGVHVVGDLDELYPEPPDETRRWRGPDKVSTKRQLDAAIDALAAMTREAASRQDPDDRLRGKLKRVRERVGDGDGAQ